MVGIDYTTLLNRVGRDGVAQQEQLFGGEERRISFMSISAADLLVNPCFRLP